MTKVIASEADVFKFMKALNGADLNGCITDFPYDTLERYRRTGTKTRLKESKDSSNPWFGVIPIEGLCEVLALLYRALAPNAYAFIYVDEATSYRLAHRLGVAEAIDKLVPTAYSRAPVDKIGFGWWTGWTYAEEVSSGVVLTQPTEEPHPTTWIKTSPADPTKAHGGMGYHGAMCTEKILCLEKGRSQLRKPRLPNAFLAQRPVAKPAGTTIAASTPKPIPIAAALTNAMSAPGGTIVDPFIGCGTHALGIARANCNALVNDANLGCFKDWMRAYKAGEAKELIQETMGRVLDFDVVYPAPRS